MNQEISQKNQVSQEDLERLELLSRADELASRTQQLSIDIEGNLISENEIEDWLARAGDDPDEKYNVYYGGIRKLLKAYLPQGKTYEQVRKFIYDEINIFLTRGRKKDSKGKRGADGKMGFFEDFKVVFEVITKWVVERGTMVDLYKAFWDLNESRGYAHQMDVPFHIEIED